MHSKRKKYYQLLVLLLLAHAPHAVAELSTFTAHYNIQSLSINQATVTNKLIIKNNTYHYQSTIQPSGWIAIINNAYHYEYSEGLIKNNQLIPHKYGYTHRQLLKSSREIEVSFNHQENKISNFHKHIDNKWKMKSIEKVQDRLSSQLSLMLALQQSNIPKQSIVKKIPSSEEAINGNAKFNYFIADGGRLKQYSFTILAEEKLETPLGLLNTIKLEHRRSNQDEIMIIWCAEEFAYLPVKILQKQVGLPDYISIIDSYEKK